MDLRYENLPAEDSPHAGRRGTAVVQHSISAKTREGEQYDNEDCWVYQCRDGKIAKIEEYADTLKAARIMKWSD